MTADEIFAQIRRWSDMIACAEMEREEAKRTIYVPGPASAVKLEALLVAHGLDDVITVECSRYLPADTWIVVDHQAIEAANAEALQQMRLTFEPETNGCCGREVGVGHRPGCMIGNYAWAAAMVREPTSWIRVIGA